MRPNARWTERRVVFGLAATVLLVGCSRGGSPTPSPNPSAERRSPRNESPTLSPSPIPSSGGVIAFLSGNSSGQRIFVMNADGSGLQRITKDPMCSSGLSWSPDGTKIAFDHGISEGQGQIDVVDVSSGRIRTLATRNDP